MANAFYSKGREAFATAQVNWVSDTIKVTLLDVDADTPNLATDQYLSDILSGARIATATLAGKTATDGVLKASDVTFSAVTGNQSEALVIWKDTGNPSTSPLLMFIDQAASGLPLTPNGGDAEVKWHVDGIAIL